MLLCNSTLGRDYSNYKVGEVVSIPKSKDCFFDDKDSNWWEQNPNKIKSIVDVFYVITSVEKDVHGSTKLSLVTKAFNQKIFNGYVSDERLEAWQLPTRRINDSNISEKLKGQLLNEVSDEIGQKFNRPLMEKME